MRIGSIVVHTAEFDQTVAFWRAALLYTAHQEAEVQRLLNLGAKRYPWRYRPGADFVVLEDPGGNLFCVVTKPDLPPD